MLHEEQGRRERMRRKFENRTTGTYRGVRITRKKHILRNFVTRIRNLIQRKKNNRMTKNR